VSELEKLLLRRHLGRCEECRAFATDVQTLTRAIRASEVSRPSRAVVVRPARRPLRVGWRARLGVAAVALAAGLGALVGWIGASSRGDVEPSDDGVITIVQAPPPAQPPPAPAETEPIAPQPPAPDAPERPV
jgi:hypothetical protein